MIIGKEFGVTSFDESETTDRRDGAQGEADMGATRTMGDSDAGETPGAEGDFGPGTSGEQEGTEEDAQQGHTGGDA